MQVNTTRPQEAERNKSGRPLAPGSACWLEDQSAGGHPKSENIKDPVQRQAIRSQDPTARLFGFPHHQTFSTIKSTCSNQSQFICSHTLLIHQEIRSKGARKSQTSQRSAAFAPPEMRGGGGQEEDHQAARHLHQGGGISSAGGQRAGIIRKIHSRQRHKITVLRSDSSKAGNIKDQATEVAYRRKGPQSIQVRRGKHQAQIRSGKTNS
uniref:Uncharacterized protein n=1 Tax=Knipowitschia caucasica TaxID=637954 RepID=A0AAV2KMA0_KNICA